MTSTASFKDKIKQAYSIFKWDLKACSGTLVVFAILASVFMVIILTLCMVVAFSSNSSAENGMISLFQIVDSNQFSIAVQAFQILSSLMVYFLTIVFTIFYTIKVFSYLHNKRKADLYGALPVSRITLFLSKTATAFLLSIVPAMFFMGIMSLISVCMGQPIVADASQFYAKLIMGTLACVSAYGLISVCCGTTINSVIMFITVCVAYPLSAMFVKGVAGSFFQGLYLGIFKDNFIMNALNPLAAYDGINIIYWLVFSAVCLVTASLLAKKRKAERAQSSFAYYLPCHIIKVLVAFLIGMFLGTIFGALNVFGYGYCGFVFGFVLGSVPAFIICHLIFYKGFSKLLKTAVPLGGLIVVVVIGMALCNFDLIGYNSFLPNTDEVESAGFIDSSYCYLKNGEKVGSLAKGAATDFSDKDDVKEIIAYHKLLISGTNVESDQKFAGVWSDMITDNLDFDYYTSYAVAYKLNSGKTVTRVYKGNDMFTNYDSTLTIESDYIVKQKEYVQKYSGMTRANIDEFTKMYISGVVNKKEVGSSLILSTETLYYDDASPIRNSTENIETGEKIRNAFMKDLIADQTNSEDVLLNYDIDNVDEYLSYNGAIYDITTFEYAKRNNPDIVCQIYISADNYDISTPASILFGSDYSMSTADETFLVPTRYTNTISALKEAGILNDDLSLNSSSSYFLNSQAISN